MPADGVLRRSVLKATAVAVGTLATSVPVAARYVGPDGEPIGEGVERAVDSPEGFGVEVLSGHATFPDAVAARFQVTYDGGDDSIESSLPVDALSVIIAKVTWQPAGTSGWHTHPGPVIVSIVEGELEVVNERDAVTRTYTAGEAFIDLGQGSIHIASNPSETDTAVAYATYLGVSDGAPATKWVVPPVDC
jgi:quercetin dioxygenase-like cupin family protein